VQVFTYLSNASKGFCRLTSQDDEKVSKCSVFDLISNGVKIAVYSSVAQDLATMFFDPRPGSQGILEP
jgi:hypothetical protein